MNRPLGRTTRPTSRTAARSPGIVHKASVQVTVSKLSSANSSAWASPTRRSASRPVAAASRRASSSISGAQLDAGRADVVGVVAEVTSGPDGAVCHDDRTVTEIRRNGNPVGERIELARYSVPIGQRVLYGQRVHGVVRFLQGEDVVLVQPSGGSEDNSCRFPVVAVDAARPLGGSAEPIGEES
jgi:hypothetical protein